MTTPQQRAPSLTFPTSSEPRTPRQPLSTIANGASFVAADLLPAEGQLRVVGRRNDRVAGGCIARPVGRFAFCAEPAKAARVAAVSAGRHCPRHVATPPPPPPPPPLSRAPTADPRGRRDVATPAAGHEVCHASRRTRPDQEPQRSQDDERVETRRDGRDSSLVAGRDAAVGAMPPATGSADGRPRWAECRLATLSAAPQPDLPRTAAARRPPARSAQPRPILAQEADLPSAGSEPLDRPASEATGERGIARVRGRPFPTRRAARAPTDGRTGGGSRAATSGRVTANWPDHLAPGGGASPRRGPRIRHATPASCGRNAEHRQRRRTHRGIPVH
ncbi:sterile alpha motif domain-containing protein 1-like [Schistocerca serialis cubense]|uniref:sterile alpha motif domain-containing protein 1-like n=1 Tax=Schistocerca serialis cubense TaxID=2023355 RepID=UPI00214E3E08|nr:sterile alpha motif domain-containing protein 1-like [Schistocerca serialis cubense]